MNHTFSAIKPIATPTLLATAIALSLPAGAIHAATGLNTVNVTANRMARTADETLASVTVITAEDIEQRQAQSLQELLVGQAGLTMTNNGGRGKNSSLFLRGTESDHILVMVNGIKIGSATNGQSPFQHLPLSQIERIEIVRGPRSSLYGSEAIGGVIQIFTKRGKGKPTPFGSIAYGSHGSTELVAGLSGGVKEGWYQLSFGREETDGYNACRGSATAGCFVIDQPDDDGYKKVFGSVSGGYQLADRLHVSGHFSRANSDVETDGSAFAGNSSNARTQVMGVELKANVTESWDVTLAAGQSIDNSSNYFNGTTPVGAFNTKRTGYSLQNDLMLSDDHILTLGADYQKDEVDSSVAFSESSRDNKAVFGQYQGAYGPHDLQLSLRWDDNQQFGEEVTGGAAYGFKFDNGLRLSAAYGTAFKAPTFNELYFPGFGNPNTVPENSETYELGIAGNHAWGIWRVNAFRTNVDNLIAFDAGLGLANNISKAVIDGLELTATTRYDQWRIDTNLTLLDPRNRSASNYNNLLARRTQQSLRVDVNRQFSGYSLGASFLAEDRRFDNLANTARVPGYLVVDLMGEYELSSDLTLQGRIGNLFDEQYETVNRFPQDERNFNLKLVYQPK